MPLEEAEVKVLTDSSFCVIQTAVKRQHFPNTCLPSAPDCLPLTATFQRVIRKSLVIDSGVGNMADVILKVPFVLIGTNGTGFERHFMLMGVDYWNEIVTSDGLNVNLELMSLVGSLPQFNATQCL